MKNKLGWNHKILLWDWYALVLGGLPGWDRITTNKVVPCVWLEIIRGQDKESLEIAREWDDICQADFYYRDHTTSSLPVVRDGETYWAQFWFRLKSDAMRFQKLFGGYGNWQDGFDEMLKQWARENGREV